MTETSKPTPEAKAKADDKAPKARNVEAVNKDIDATSADIAKLNTKLAGLRLEGEHAAAVERHAMLSDVVDKAGDDPIARKAAEREVHNQSRVIEQVQDRIDQHKAATK